MTPNLPRRKSPRLEEFDYATPNIIVSTTLNCSGKKPLFADDACARVAIGAMAQERERLRHAVYVYCIMPDHVHFLLSPLESGRSVVEFLGGFSSRVTRAVQAMGHRGRVFQRSFYDHVVRKQEDFRTIAEYILNNPVRAGLVDSGEDYPYSGSIDPLPM